MAKKNSIVYGVTPNELSQCDEMRICAMLFNKLSLRRQLDLMITFQDTVLNHYAEEIPLNPYQINASR